MPRIYESPLFRYQGSNYRGCRQKTRGTCFQRRVHCRGLERDGSYRRVANTALPCTSCDRITGAIRSSLDARFQEVNYTVNDDTALRSFLRGVRKESSRKRTSFASRYHSKKGVSITVELEGFFPRHSARKVSTNNF